MCTSQASVQCCGIVIADAKFSHSRDVLVIESNVRNESHKLC